MSIDNPIPTSMRHCEPPLTSDLHPSSKILLILKARDWFHIHIWMSGRYRKDAVIGAMCATLPAHTHATQKLHQTGRN